MVHRFWLLVSAGILVILAIGTVDSIAADGTDQAASDAILKSIRSRLPAGWQASSTTLGDGSMVFDVSSEKEMPLHPSPASGLNHRDVRARCVLMIDAGEKLSIEAQSKAWNENKKREHYKGEKQVWIPSYYDGQYGYSVRSPGYCPNKEEDRKTVIECFEAITRDWKVYPTASRSELTKRLSYIMSLGQPRK